jgi:Indolepyruvate ferredoxin oxidoreductase, alpha and beta subunits
VIELSTTKRVILGNEAIAFGALSAGVSIAAGYPGTPSTEIIETLMAYGKIYTEWSANEKVAFETAYGAAINGAFALTTMKHVGLNVAADPLMSSSYTGVEGALVIVSADDPSMWSSQNEQDNRYYGLHALIPVIEPYDPQSAHDLTIEAFKLSNKVKHPVILRSTTRIGHIRGPVELKPPSRPIWVNLSKTLNVTC